MKMRIHLCEVNQFVAAPIDHSFKQEQTEPVSLFHGSESSCSVSLVLHVSVIK